MNGCQYLLPCFFGCSAHDAKNLDLGSGMEAGSYLPSFASLDIHDQSVLIFDDELVKVAEDGPPSTPMEFKTAPSGTAIPVSLVRRNGGLSLVTGKCLATKN